MDNNEPEYKNTKIWKRTLINLRRLAGWLGEKHVALIDRLVRQEADRVGCPLPDETDEAFAE